MMRVVVIGGGIAGASLTYFLSRMGAQVTLVDATQDTASAVPSALLNPVRGQSGQVDVQMIAGMRRTWALVRELEQQGQQIPHAQSGLFRPVPDVKTLNKFREHLPSDLPHEWLQPAQSSVQRFVRLREGWERVLWLPEAGWIAGQALIDALKRVAQQHGAQVIHGRAQRWAAQEVQLDRLEQLETFDQAHAPIHAPAQAPAQTPTQTLTADHVVFCGGSLGAWWRNEQTPRMPRIPETHRMGTLLHLDHLGHVERRDHFPAVPLSFGVYFAPHRSAQEPTGQPKTDVPRTGVLGATFEAPRPEHQAAHLPLKSLQWLLGKGAALVSSQTLQNMQVTGQWTGVRLSNLRAGRAKDGSWELLGLGSKGFLLGPLYAETLAKELAES